MKKWPDGKPYYSLNQYYKDTYGRKIYKVALDIGTTCPNRDGSLATGGCLFCSNSGSGDFAEPITSENVDSQIEKAIRRLNNKHTGNGYVAYLQSYTNTYGDYKYLKAIYEAILSHDTIIGLNIGTRPDCLDDKLLKLLERLNEIKPITIELGLQTIHESTAKTIRRFYKLNVFNDAIAKLTRHKIPVVVHLIAGLPGEGAEDFLQSVQYVAKMNIHGIKLQMLHVLEDSNLGDLYRQTPFELFTLESYADLIVDAIGLIPENIVIHRITGDGNKTTLIEPKWTLNKRHVLNTIHKTFVTKNKWQGSDTNTPTEEGDTL